MGGKSVAPGLSRKGGTPFTAQKRRTESLPTHVNLAADGWVTAVKHQVKGPMPEIQD